MLRFPAFHRHRPALLALLGYTVGNVALTYPLLFRLSEGIKHLPLGDPGQHFWNIWWLGKGLGDPELSIFWTDYLYYPVGAGLAYHAYHPLLSLGVLILRPLVGEVAAYNLVLWVGPLLSACGMYLCAQEWGAPPRAAWVAGFLFLFAPFRTEIWTHWEIQSTQWIPFYFLFLHRAMIRGGMANIIGCALALIFTALTAWYHLAALLAVSLVLAPALAFSKPPEGNPRRRLMRLLAAASITVLLFSPYIRVLIQQREPTSTVPQFEALHHWSSDVLHYVLPVPLQKAIGPHLYRPYYRFEPFGNHLVYPGTGLWVLVLASLFLLKRKVRCWWLLASAAVLFILSLGPALKCGTLVRFPGTTWVIPLPGYFLLRKVPLLNSLRTTCRLGIGVTPLLALFAALNWERLAARVPAFLADHQRILCAAICLLALFEGWSAPVETHPVETPAIYDVIASDRKPASVIEVPCTAIEDLARSMYFQTFHEHPLVGGYLARPSVAFEALAVRSTLITLLRDPVSTFSFHFSSSRRRSLHDQARSINLRYIVVHADRLSPSEREGTTKLVGDLLGCTLIASDGPHELYRLHLD